jgi:hypothetical protein
LIRNILNVVNHNISGTALETHIKNSIDKILRNATWLEWQIDNIWDDDNVIKERMDIVRDWIDQFFSKKISYEMSVVSQNVTNILH